MIPGIYGIARNVCQECPFWALRVGVLKTRNAQTPENGVETETLTKRIFAPKTPHCRFLGVGRRVRNGGLFYSASLRHSYRLFRKNNA